MWKEKLKKYGLPILAAVVGLIVYLYFRARSAANSSAAVDQGQQPQLVYSGAAMPPDPAPGTDYWNGTAWIPYQTNAGAAVDTTAGSATGATAQPSTSSSGVSAASPTVTPYISPSQNVTMPSPATIAAATSNPFASNPADLSGLQIQGVGLEMAEAGTSGNTALDLAAMVAMMKSGLAPIPEANSYLNSPAFTMSQAAMLQDECAMFPGSPACQTAIVTGENVTGAPTLSSVAFEAGQYCEQNNFNAGFFGMAPDSANCTGNTPNSSLVGTIVSNIIGPGSSGPSWGANSGVGNLPANWNTLTAAQQMAWAQTGVVPVATTTGTTTSGTTTTTTQTSVVKSGGFGSNPIGTNTLGQQNATMAAVERQIMEEMQAAMLSMQ